MRPGRFPAIPLPILLPSPIFDSMQEKSPDLFSQARA